MVTDDSQFLACLELFQKGGGIVNVKYSGSIESLVSLFQPDWIQHHYASLSMLTLNLPSYGCFSLLHPSITFWELERTDIKPLEES
jgi:hypothetical protein